MFGNESNNLFAGLTFPFPNQSNENETAASTSVQSSLPRQLPQPNSTFQPGVSSSSWSHLYSSYQQTPYQQYEMSLRQNQFPPQTPIPQLQQQQQKPQSYQPTLPSSMPQQVSPQVLEPHVLQAQVLQAQIPQPQIPPTSVPHVLSSNVQSSTSLPPQHVPPAIPPRNNAETRIGTNLEDENHSKPPSNSPRNVTETGVTNLEYLQRENQLQANDHNKTVDSDANSSVIKNKISNEIEKIETWKAMTEMEKFRMQERMMELEKEIEKWKMKFRESENQMRNVKLKLDREITDRTLYNQKDKTLREIFEVLNAEFEEMKKQENKYDQLENVIKHYNEQLSNDIVEQNLVFKETVNQFEIQRDNIKKYLEQERQEKKELIEKHEIAISQLENQIEKIQSEKQNLTKENQTLQATLAENFKKLEQEKFNYDDLQQKFQEKEENNQTLSNQLLALQNENNQLIIIKEEKLKLDSELNLLVS